MNTRRTTTIRVGEGVANERIPPSGVKVPIVGQEDVNEEVPPNKQPHFPQISPMPQGPQDLFVEWDMSNAQLRTALRDWI